MTILFTEEEKKYLVIVDTGEYGFAISKDAPPEIRKSMNEKIASNKKWLESGGVDG